MERNLIFNESLTVEQFKAKFGVDKISVRSMPMRDEANNVLRDKDNKVIYHPTSDNMFFFTYGAKTGAVSRKGIPAHPMLSNVTDPSNGSNFWLLHEEGQGGAPVVVDF